VSVLTIEGITKSYGKIKALKGVSFEVTEGSVFGLLGPNGSGKTTLLSIILDVLKADSGQFYWFGVPGTPELRKHIGTLLETPNFYHYLSAFNNLKITSEISGRGNLAAIEEVLKTVSLYERRNSPFSTYSLGMKQRLAIAAALLGKPKILVLDEPTNGLDPVGIAEIRDLIGLLQYQGFTIIIASHLLDEIEKICSHVAILKQGELVAVGTVKEVLADEDTIEVGYHSPDLLLRILQNIPGFLRLDQEGKIFKLHFAKGVADAENVNNYCFSQGIVLNHLVLKKKKLEQRFLELTGNQ
jgi:ABC-2 type transport system ATP-binding protein